MSNKTGGPAFPVDRIGPNNEGEMISSFGMTLRDYFAAKAMQAHLSAQWNHFYEIPADKDVSNLWDDSQIAMSAYDIADAMIEVRNAN